MAAISATISSSWWIPLVEQLTSTLALDRHQEKQQQLIVMEERATIARELHDSIAQSLSCMKMQVGCLQMQATPCRRKAASCWGRSVTN